MNIIILRADNGMASHTGQLPHDSDVTLLPHSFPLDGGKEAARAVLRRWHAKPATLPKQIVYPGYTNVPISH